jgi:signal transduction histidine kinase
LIAARQYRQFMSVTEKADESPADRSTGDPHIDSEIEAQVAARVTELSELNANLVRTIEADRSALAKHLHDELGGLITAAKMDMSWLSTNLAGVLDGPKEEKFRSVMQLLNQAMMLKRSVVESLRPSLLDHFGLPVALRSHFDEHCHGAGLECIATMPEEMPDLDHPTQLTIFRIAQEILVRIIGRGGSKHVELVIEPEGNGYRLLLGDDGGPLTDAERQAMTGIRYRVLSVGGTIGVESVPGQGNRITVFVPRSPKG